MTIIHKLTENKISPFLSSRKNLSPFRKKKLFAILTWNPWKLDEEMQDEDGAANAGDSLEYRGPFATAEFPKLKFLPVSV
jgi:hypothetical protein